MRYLSLGAEGGSDLTAAEAQTILAAGLSLMPVQHVNATGWCPTAELGTAHGQAAAADAQAVGLPAGVNVWLDLEGCGEAATAADVTAYCTCWYSEVDAAGFTPGLYVGWHPGLDAQQLGALPFQHYWRSASDVPTVARGYQMLQSLQQTVSGIQVDVDTTQDDAMSGQVQWLSPSPGAASAPASAPVLREGMSGADVSTLQAALNAAGAAPELTVDGSFGAATLAAVEGFQSAQGLTADGVAGAGHGAALQGS